jgi:hypothetical protein
MEHGSFGSVPQIEVGYLKFAKYLGPYPRSSEPFPNFHAGLSFVAAVVRCQSRLKRYASTMLGPSMSSNETYGTASNNGLTRLRNLRRVRPIANIRHDARHAASYNNGTSSLRPKLARVFHL